MPVNPLLVIVTAGIIGAGVFIRIKKHPVVPVITLFSMLALAMLIACLFVIDSAVMPQDQSKAPPLFLVNLIVLGYDGNDLSILYNAFNIIKYTVILFLLAVQTLLFAETGLILNHKKERQ